MNGQLALTDLYPCDICHGTGKADHDDLQIGVLTTRRCVVCNGTGSLDYNPEGCNDNPFNGLEQA